MTQSDYMLADIRKMLEAVLAEIKKLNKTMSAKNGAESKKPFFANEKDAALLMERMLAARKN